MIFTEINLKKISWHKLKLQLIPFHEISSISILISQKQILS